MSFIQYASDNFGVYTFHSVKVALIVVVAAAQQGKATIFTMKFVGGTA